MKKKTKVIRVKKEKKIKLKSLSSLKNKAWNLCSQYIRRKYADKNGNCRCVTCGKVLPWKALQASHFVAGRSNGILFDERGIYPACVICNVFKHGNIHEYMKFLEGKLGVQEAMDLRNELIENSKKIVKVTREDYEQLISKYQSLLKEMK